MAISLKQFLDRNNISFRLYSICTEAEIQTLEALQAYLKQNRNFDKLIDIKPKEKSFLTDLCHGVIKDVPKEAKVKPRLRADVYSTPTVKKRNEPIVYNTEAGVSLYKLWEEGKLSSNLYNRCDDAGIKGLNHLQLFMEEHGNFDNLNLSKKANKELHDLYDNV